MTALRKLAERYTVARIVKDRSVPPRYRQSGWMVFDTKHQRHGQVWPTKAEAEQDAARMNQQHAERGTR
jgi:hypothetical protein